MQPQAPIATPGLRKGAPQLRACAALFVLALLFTLLNACKPLTVDDTAHYYYAAQIAEHPLDPYGFKVFWYEEPEPANYVLTPLLSDYWWSLAIRLFGQRPWLWKLWLLPFSLVFVGSLYSLFRRFASGLEMILVVMTVLSPTFLPSFNLMLDVPALALSLCSVAVFLHACDRGSVSLSAAAGLVAGLAMQTKYTGFLAPAVMLLFAALFGKLREGLVAATAAALLFGAWEWIISWLYGESHFLYHLRDASAIQGTKYVLAIPLVCVLGALTPATALLGLAALRLPPRWLALADGVTLLAYLLVAGVPEKYAGFGCRLGPYAERITVGDVFFGTLGVCVLATAAAVLWRLCRLGHGPWRRPARWRRYRVECFLLLWFALEIAGYFALSPFPAARRVMGIIVVFTLFTGRLGSRTCRTKARRPLVQSAALASVLLGLGFYGVDLRDAFAERQAAQETAELLRPLAAGGTVWYVGHWGFQFYAEQAGMRPVVPEESRLHKGEWLVMPDERIEQQKIELDKHATELMGIRSVDDLLPLRTVSCYYGGRTPLQHHEGPRVSVHIYRVTADFTPAARSVAGP